MKRRLIVIFLILCFLVGLNICNSNKMIERVVHSNLLFDGTNEKDYLKINIDTSNINSGDSVKLNISLDGLSEDINTLQGMIEYDKALFYELSSSSFIPSSNWSGLVYNDGNFVLERDALSKSTQNVLSVSLQAKSGITASTKTTITIKNVIISGGNTSDGENGDIVVGLKNTELNIDKTISSTTPSKEVEDTSEEHLIVDVTVTDDDIQENPKTGSSILFVIFMLIALVIGFFVYHFMRLRKENISLIGELKNNKKLQRTLFGVLWVSVILIVVVLSIGGTFSLSTDASKASIKDIIVGNEALTSENLSVLNKNNDNKITVTDLSMVINELNNGSIVNPSDDGDSKVIYVSPNGNDNNDATSDKPLKTISKALEVARNNRYINNSDVTISLANGTYNITSPIEITDADTNSSHKLTIIGGNNSVISGGVKLGTNWQTVSGNIYAIDLSSSGISEINELFVNGERKKISRSPEYVSTSNDYKILEKISNTKYIISIPKSSSMSLDKVSKNGVVLPDLKINHIFEWKNDIFYVKSVSDDGNNIIFELSSDTVVSLETEKPRNVESDYILTNPTKSRVYIINTYSYLDEEGEFYYNTTEKKLYYYSSVNPNNQEVIVPVSNGLLKIHGNPVSQGSDTYKLATNIDIKNVIFNYGTSSDNDMVFASGQADSGYTSDGGVLKAKFRDYAVVFDKVSNINILNNNFSKNGVGGIWLVDYVYNVNIKDNVFTDLSGGAIAIGRADQLNHLTGNNYDGEWTQKDQRPLPNGGTNFSGIYSVETDYDYHSCMNDGKIDVFYCSYGSNLMPAGINVLNNRISNIGVDYLTNPAISVYFANTVNIKHNTITDVPHVGISIGWGWVNSYNQYITKLSGNIDVSYNYIKNVESKIQDGAHIYSLGISGKGLKVHDNYLDTTIRDSGGYHGGLYTDEGTENYEAYNNVVVNTKNWFFGKLYLSSNDSFCADKQKIGSNCLAVDAMLKSSVHNNYYASNSGTANTAYGESWNAISGNIFRDNIAVDNWETSSDANAVKMRAIRDAAGVK